MTPMMQQYCKTKEEYKDCILFYRLGDFYEMFFEDALTASKELEITLTGKDCGMEERAPMCGIPYHAYENYMNRLVEKGYKVAICEQVEDPKTAKGIVKREVIQIVTPGTNMSANSLNETKNNYLMSIYRGEHYGISFADITTGDFFTTEVDRFSKVMDEISKFAPVEILINEAVTEEEDGEHMARLEQLHDKEHTMVSVMEDWYYESEMDERLIKEQFHVMNLELCETMRDKNKRGSLLWVLDKTKTAMGARTLRAMVEQPCIRKDRIEERLDAVEAFNDSMITRDELREYLSAVYDLERLMTRITLKSANPRDLIAFKNSIGILPHVKSILKEFDTGLLAQYESELDELKDLYAMIDAAIIEEPPILIKEGGMIKDSYIIRKVSFRQRSTVGTPYLPVFCKCDTHHNQ